MCKPIVHVILPVLPEGSLEAARIQRAMGSLQRQLHGCEVRVHSGDSAYEQAKNPSWMKEDPVYRGGVSGR